MVSFNSQGEDKSVILRPTGIHQGWRDGGISIHTHNSLSALANVQNDLHGELRMTVVLKNSLDRASPSALNYIRAPGTTCLLEMR
jgi:hypothetical protein